MAGNVDEGKSVVKWDVFISHASEDKDRVARPLAELLRRHGLLVWLDEQELLVGDRLRAKIDEGLSQSRWGVVVLSQTFLRKDWPTAELDALISRECSGTKVLLPVWHEISAGEIAARSPLLAARMGIDTARGIGAVCDAILRAMGRMNAGTAPPNQVFRRRLDSWSVVPRPTPGSTYGTIQFLKSHDNYRGEVLDSYVLVDLLGLGGAGAVFRAKHRALGNVVAVKLFYPIPAPMQDITRATERAVRGLASIQHESIAKLFDFGYLNIGSIVTVFMAYELIEGVNLSKWGPDVGTSEATLLRRFKIAIRLTDALEVAHSCRFVGDLGFAEVGVMHGDIKPSNILVSRENDRPVLVDFMIPDIQRLLAGNTAMERRDPLRGWRSIGGKYHYFDCSTNAFGTPGYMPPEQELEGIVTPASDIYALGHTLSSLLYWSDRPSGAGSLADAGRRLEKLLERMVKPDPDDRPVSMGAVNADLRLIAEDVESYMPRRPGIRAEDA